MPKIFDRKTYENSDGSRSITMSFRPNSSDERCLKEVIDKQVYRRKQMGFGVETGEHWLDLGANIGAFGAYVYLNGATADCWEPEPNCFKLLEQNLRQLEGFTLHQSAITDNQEPQLEFFSGSRPGDFYRSTIVPKNGESRYLPNTHASELKRTYDGVKLDIEGAELGLLDASLIPPCRKLVMEYHLLKDRDVERFKQRMEKIKERFNIVSWPKHVTAEYANGQYPFAYDTFVFCMSPK